MSDTVVIGAHVCGAEVHRAEVRCESGRNRVRLQTVAREAVGGSSGPGNGSASAPFVAVASVVPSDVTSRYWMLPDADAATLRQMVQHRLEADLPVPSEELVWGYRTAASKGPDGARGVLVQAARRNRIAGQLQAWPTSGVPLTALTTEAEAIGALYRHGLELPAWQGTDVLVLCQPAEWTVAILSGGLVRCLRRVRIGSGGIEGACRETEQLVRANSSDVKSARIVWCGSDQAAGGGLAERLGLPVVTPGVPKQLETEDGTTIGPDALAEFGVALGLALGGIYEQREMIRLDGLPRTAGAEQAEQVRRMLAHPGRWTAAGAAALFLALLVHIVGMAWESRLMNALLERPVEASREKNAERETKVRAMQRLERYRLDVEGIMAAVAAPLPENVLISSVQIARERRLTIRGTAKDPKAVFTYAEALRKSPRFGSVNPERTEPGQGGTFTITAELKGVEKLTSLQGGGARWR